MSNKADIDLKPSREQWFVFLFVFWSVGISLFDWFTFGHIRITDQKLMLKSPFEIAYSRYQFMSWQISKVSASKALYLISAPPLLFIFAYFLFLFLAFEDRISLLMLAIAIIALIVASVPILFFKSFRIYHNIGSYPKHIYFLCLRRHSSSITDALTRCGFVDKVEQ